MSQTHCFEDFEFHCYENCIKPLEDILEDHKDRLNITEYSFDLASKTGKVVISDDTLLTFQENEQELNQLLKNKLPEGNPKKRKRAHLWQALLGLTSGMAIMLPMVLNLAMPWWVHPLFTGFGSVLTLFLGRKSFVNAYHSLKSKHLRFNMDSLFTISAVSAIVSSVLHHFFPIIPPLVDAALMIFGFRHGGLWLQESFTQQRLTSKKFVDYGRESKFQVSYLKNGVYEDCQISDLQIGDYIKVPADQVVPLNGNLLDEEAYLSFKLHNGSDEGLPHQKGGPLLAGMVPSQDILMQVTALEADSELRRRDLQLIEAQKSKPPIEELTSRIMQWFVPTVLTTAVLIGVAATYFFGLSLGLTAAFYWGVTACPCALGLITPLAMRLGLSQFKNTGLSFNKAKGLQAAASVDTVIFDLTGTLTQNKPQIIGEPTIHRDYNLLISAIQSRVLSDKALKRKQPIARAILNSIGTTSEKIDFDQFEVADNGVLATCDGNVYRMGNSAFIKPPREAQPQDLPKAAQVIYFEKNGIVQGYFLIDDPLRPGAEAVVNTLIDNGILCQVLTGGDDKTADRLSKILKLDRSRFITNRTPDSKAAHVKQLKESGLTVCMIGDAENDNEAMACADLSIAIGSPASPEITTRTADACLDNASLRPLLQVFPVGAQVMRVIKQNLTFSFAFNAFSLVYLGLSLVYNPAMLIPFVGAVVMTSLSAVVTLNTYRALRQPESFPIMTPTSPSSSPSPSPSPSPNTQPKYEFMETRTSSNSLNKIAIYDNYSPGQDKRQYKAY